MSDKSPKPLSELMFRPGSPIADLARRADAGAGLAEHLRAGMPADLAAHIRAASLRPDGTLVVLATSSAWAARLRFEAERLLLRCREREAAAASVLVRVAGPPGPG